MQSLVPSVVADLLRRAPLSSGSLGLAWRISVGPALARATDVRLAAPGVVGVTARDERWRAELRRSKRVILARVQALVGVGRVTRIEIEGARDEE